MQLEVITAEQMLDAYASVGMPVNYRHWSFGKQFIATEKSYRRGHMGLAYEIVINSDPCIAYLMEENTMPMQALVIAHACYGHNSFFKGNYLFRMWTDAGSIIDYLVYARKLHRRVRGAARRGRGRAGARRLPCADEPRRGPLPPARRSCRWRRSRARAQGARGVPAAADQRPVAHAAAHGRPQPSDEPRNAFPAEPQENILYFIEKNAPLLEPWQREIVRIVRKVAQYFYPQRQTQVMNEGWATFWHYTLLNTLYDEGRLADGFMMEFLQSHTNVVFQPPVDTPVLQRHQPVCARASRCSRTSAASAKHPTARGPRAGSPTSPAPTGKRRSTTRCGNFKDESFIGQYLSPQLMREFRLFSIVDDADEKRARGRRHPRRQRLPARARGACRGSTT